jgi:hypothetical protein
MSKKKEMKTTEIYSIWRCALEAPVKTRSYKEALAEAKRDEKMGTAGRNMNPLQCPYNYVRIDGQIYKRGSGNIFDDDCDYQGTTCHDCGVLYGNIHHVDCDCELCPVPDCGDQFISCPHSIGTVYYKGLGDSKGTLFTGPIWTQNQGRGSSSGPTKAKWTEGSEVGR